MRRNPTRHDTEAGTPSANSDDLVTIRIAECGVTSTGEMIVTRGLGSCLGLSLFDCSAAVAGLAHIQLPDTSGGDTQPPAAKYATDAVEHLWSQLKAKGATIEATEAKLAGGATMFDLESKPSIGTKNVTQTENALRDIGIPTTEKDVGGDHARTLYLDGGTGELIITEHGDETNRL